MPLIKDLVPQVWGALTSKLTAEGPVGLPTGLSQLDELVGDGWNRQELTYLMGDSGKGKSWLASSFVVRGAQWLQANPDKRPLSGYITKGGDGQYVQEKVKAKEGKTPLIVFWSLEMGEIPVVMRMMSQMLADTTGEKIDSSKLRNRENGEALPQSQLLLLYQLLGTLGEYVFVEFEARTVEQFCGVLDTLVDTHDICFVVVDYFRLIQVPGEYGASMVSAQEERSKSLRWLAREYDCHVLSIFDINREGQKDGRVETYHMRGGVAAQYDADLVLSIQWANNERDHDFETDSLVRIEVSVLKNRNGRLGTVECLIDLSNGYVAEFSKYHGGILKYSSSSDIAWTKIRM